MSGAAATRAETRAIRAGVLRALVIAAAILAIFNSEGLRIAAGDLSETRLGRSLLAASEAWDGAMERAGTKTLAAGVRDFIGEAREASWTDLAAIVEAPVFAFWDRSGAGEPPPETYTGAVPKPVKYRGDREPRPFKRSGAAGR